MASYIISHSFLFTNEERETIYRSSSSVDTRPVSFVTRVFYPALSFISQQLIPETVAPNAITVAGLLSCMQAYQLIHTYYRFGEPPPAVASWGGGPGGRLSTHTGAEGGDEVITSLKALGVRGAGRGSLGPEKAFPSFLPTEESVPAAESLVLTYESFFQANRTVQTATILAVLLLLVSIICGSLDGVHARRCRSATSLGDIFARVCSSASRIFIALILLEVMEIDAVETKWYVLLFLQLIEFNTVLGRINAENIRKDKVKNWAYLATYCFRDAELSFAMLVMLLLRWLFPSLSAAYLQRFLPSSLRGLYVGVVVISFLNVALLRMKKRLKSTIAICLAARVVPVFYLLPLSDYNTLSLIGDAMVVGLLSIEVYISHLARRRAHAAVTFITVFSLLNDIFAIFFTLSYILGVLVDLSYSLNVPLFVPVQNVYIDGVFDLCHAGHKRMMANALKFGNRLIVGVCGDEECETYKRRPIMTTEERVNEVRLCKYVSEVIPNAPVSGITVDMIRFYNVHIVVCGEEYDTPEDTYYAVPRKMGILRSVPRTEGISTSVLIKRIRLASDAEMEAKDKASGKSKVKEGS